MADILSSVIKPCPSGASPTQHTLKANCYLGKFDQFRWAQCVPMGHIDPCHLVQVLLSPGDGAQGYMEGSSGHFLTQHKGALAGPPGVLLHNYSGHNVPLMTPRHITGPSRDPNSRLACPHNSSLLPGQAGHPYIRGSAHSLTPQSGHELTL